MVHPSDWNWVSLGMSEESAESKVKTGSSGGKCGSAQNLST